MKRIGLFIDGSNMYMSAKALGFRVDFTKLLNYYKNIGEVTHAFYFTALPPKDVQSSLRKMVDYVDYNGYTVIQKETKKYTNTDGSDKLKGNMDVDIAIHACETAPFISHLVLFSGDGDFKSLLESVQRRYGIFCTVVSAKSLVADGLRRQANEYVDLLTLKDALVHEQDAVEREAKRVKRFRFLDE